MRFGRSLGQSPFETRDISPVIADQCNVSHVLAGLADGMTRNLFDAGDDDVSNQDTRPPTSPSGTPSVSTVSGGGGTIQDTTECHTDDDYNFDRDYDVPDGLMDGNAFEEDIHQQMEDFLGPSIDSYYEFLQDEKNSTVLKWTDVAPKDTNIFVSFNHARSQVFQQLKVEVDYYRKRWRSLIGKDTLSLGDFLLLFFDIDGTIFQLFKSTMKCSYDEFLAYITTYLVCCAYGVSAEELYSRQSLIKSDNLLSKEKYVAMTKSLTNGKQSRFDLVNGTKRPFWLQLEDAINDRFRELFVEDFPEDQLKKIVQDDDKFQFQTSRSGAETYGLKLQQHVKKNRRCFVCHQSVFYASLMLISFTFERCVK